MSGSPISKDTEDAPFTLPVEDLTSLHTQLRVFKSGSSLDLSVFAEWKLQEGKAHRSTDLTFYGFLQTWHLVGSKTILVAA